MNNITISKKEYRGLFEKAVRYEHIYKILTEDMFASPSEKSTKKIVKEFGALKRYSSDFMVSLERGLKRSTYFKK